MIKIYLNKLIGREDLSIEESYNLMSLLMSGEVNEPQISAVLVALKTKGESAEEIAGFVKAMREKGNKIELESDDAIDVCGTGGDDSGTFNISTAVAFVVAGAGVTVAKHGNVSISSKSGSADVLHELGVDIKMDFAKSKYALDNIGISFLFAPQYHPAMKHVAPVRKALGIKTIFNLIGPLTNPASINKQMIGVFNNHAMELLSKAVKYLDMERVCFVCTDNSYDEVILNKSTKVMEISSNNRKVYSISNNDFDYPLIDLNEIKGDDAKYNSEIILDLFNKPKRDAKFFIVAANAAMALFTSGFSKNLNECRMAAERSLMTGQALDKLNQLVELSKS